MFVSVVVIMWGRRRYWDVWVWEGVCGGEGQDGFAGEMRIGVWVNVVYATEH